MFGSGYENCPEFGVLGGVIFLSLIFCKQEKKLLLITSNLFVAILADNKLLVISIVEYKAKMGTEMKDSVKCFFLI
jgi:hypothetical protein